MPARARRVVYATAASAAALVVAVAVAVVVARAVRSDGAQPSLATVRASPAVLHALRSVPPQVLAAAGGTGAANAELIGLVGPTLRRDGRPLVFYLGAEFCPFCAAQRWPLAVALSHFGTLTGLGTTYSARADGQLPTLSFTRVRLASDLLSLAAVEWAGNQPAGADRPAWDPWSFRPLQRPSPAELALFHRDDPTGGIPLLDLANRYHATGAGFSPALLAGLTPSQVAADLAEPASPLGRAVDAEADELTAALCVLTGQRPATVCHAAYTRAGARSLATATG